MTRLLRRRLSDQAAVLGRAQRDYVESFKPEFPLRTLDGQEAINGAAIDALIKDIPLREAFFYAETFHQRVQTNNVNDPWRLLELVFGLHFWPENKEDPLSPLNNLSPSNIAVLRAIFVESQDAEIRSRLGDVLWLFTADLHAMEIAVDAYLESGLRLEDPAHWGHAIRRYQRAAELALDLKRKTSLRRRVSEFMLDRVRFYEGKDPYYFTAQALEILVMLRTYDPLELSRHAVIAAERARANGDSRRARACYTSAEKFSRSAKSEIGILSARTAIAETWAEEAERLDAVGDFLTVRYVWKRAILAYRRLGNETRAAELRLRLRNAKRISRRGTRSPSAKPVRPET
jgi:hypothetical protein